MYRTLSCHMAAIHHAFPAELSAFRSSSTSQPVRLYGRTRDGSVRLYDSCRLAGGTTAPKCTGCTTLLDDVAGGKKRVASTPFRLAVLENGRAVVEAGEATEPEPRILRGTAFQDGAFVAVPVELLLDLIGLTPEQLAGLKGRLQLRVRAAVAGSTGAEDLEGVYLAPYSRSWVLRGLRPWLLRSGAAVAGPPRSPAITVRLIRAAGAAATAEQQAARGSGPGRAAGEGRSAGRKRGPSFRGSEGSEEEEADEAATPWAEAVEEARLQAEEPLAARICQRNEASGGRDNARPPGRQPLLLGGVDCGFPAKRRALSLDQPAAEVALAQANRSTAQGRSSAGTREALAAAVASGANMTHASRAGEGPAEPEQDAPTAAAYTLRFCRWSLRCSLDALQHAFPAELQAAHSSGTGQFVRMYGRMPGGIRLYKGVYLTTSESDDFFIGGCAPLLSDVAGGRRRAAATPFRLAVLEDGRAVVEACKITVPVAVEGMAACGGLDAAQPPGLRPLMGAGGCGRGPTGPPARHLAAMHSAMHAGSTGSGLGFVRGCLEGELPPAAAVGGWGPTGVPGAEPGGSGRGGGGAQHPRIPGICASELVAQASSEVRLAAGQGPMGGPAASPGLAAAVERPPQQALTGLISPTAATGKANLDPPRPGMLYAHPAEDAVGVPTAALYALWLSNGRLTPGMVALQHALPAELKALRSSRISQPVRLYGRMPDGSVRLFSSARLAEYGWVGHFSGHEALLADVVGGRERVASTPFRLAVLEDGRAVVEAGEVTDPEPRGCVPPGELPPLRPGELRLCGLTFHPAAAPAVRAALEQWEADRSGAADPAADPIAVQAGPDVVGAPGSDPLVLRASLEGLLGLKAPAGAAGRPLPEGPVACGLVAPCGDPAQGHSGLRATTRIAAGSAVCVVGGYVLPRGAAEELVASGLSQCRPEVRAQVAATLEGAGTGGSAASLQAAWRLMVRSLLLPYTLPYGMAEWRAPEEALDGGPAGPLRLSQLGYGGLGALVFDYRTQTAGGEGEGDASPLRVTALGPNCTILPVFVRGVPLPVLVALRDISPGERLLRDYGEGWWRDMDVAWEAAEREGVAHQALL
ncbi:hypothetical protein HYH03_019027 [Edaphochlamys debaryana]|uniref:SET domain-containing protein n=1 Tax=Edaphochlamys debaryana TaxID=47281 RepID=A0A836BNS3_9CHLO|nr:hypothetical protein HYH03_019027 [Edaphochlamys debaryana]|eukprot:KAG2482019.1 hypothetical protein HYH03_019027 [Edaphochlamys debaryana]